MRVLHTALSASPNPGIIQQMEWEQAAAVELKIPWTTRIFLPEPTASPISVSAGILSGNRVTRYLKLRLSYFNWLLTSSQEYDIILLRHTPHDLFEARFVQKHKSKVYSVHHTLEMPEIESISSGIERCLRSSLERIIGASVLNNAWGLVGVTEEIVQFEKGRLALKQRDKQSFVYPNAILCQSTQPPDLRGQKPEFLFVASKFHPWQGLDLLLEAIRGTAHEFILHLVGEVPTELGQRCQQDSRTIVHGPLGSADIARISAKCWIGISCLALHRKNMVEACPLKVREYLDSGLPVYAAHSDSALPKDFPYFVKGRVDVSAMFSFASRMREVSKADVQIAAKPYISKLALLRKLYTEMMPERNSLDNT